MQQKSGFPAKDTKRIKADTKKFCINQNYLYAKYGRLVAVIERKKCQILQYVIWEGSDFAAPLVHKVSQGPEFGPREGVYFPPKSVGLSGEL